MNSRASSGEVPGSTGAPLADGLRQVLFGDTLEAKVRPIPRPSYAESDWDQPSTLRFTEVPEPGRPLGLRFTQREAREREPLPTDRELTDPRRLGRLLHAFANHELQAIELMAWTLLRFPDAPIAFRRGLLTILGEEQRHLRLYLGRVTELGVTPGEVPVNDFFWRTVADSPTPFDLVLRLGLVFEQANLDFTPHYAARLRRVGDAETADLLDQVTADEVGHVRHALYWFRQWKDPSLDDVSAFRDGLRLPLSTARARGPEPSRTLRREAGLDEALIDAVLLSGEVAARAPTVWYFHPGFEADEQHRERGGEGPAPEDRATQELARDLATLPQFFASAGDLILAPEPSARWRAEAAAVGLPRVEFMPLETLLRAQAREGHARRLAGVAPWGWSARSTEVANALATHLVRPAPAAWRGPEGGKLALPALRRQLGLPEGCWGRDVTSGAELACVREELGLAGFRGAVLKPAWSTAGRGQVRIGLGDPPDKAIRALAAGPMLVEPWWERLVDLSLHFDTVLTPRGTTQVRFRGAVRFVTDERGAFRSVSLERAEQGLPEELRRFLFMPYDRLAAAARELAALLAQWPGTGPVGIDLMLVREPGGGLLLLPLVELNARWTMGRVALALRPRLHPKSRGSWRILTRRAAARSGVSSLAAWAESNAAGITLEAGLWREGVWCTQDPSLAADFLGVAEVIRAEPARSPAHGQMDASSR